MNNAGNPESQNQETTDKKEKSRSPLVLVILTISVIVGAIIALQVIGVLYAIIAPPTVPLPENLSEISHESESYGVDSWFYRSEQDVCEMVNYYDSLGADCLWWLDGNVCPGDKLAADVYLGNQVAVCKDEVDFSIFVMGWEIRILVDPNDHDNSQLRVSREIFWTGNVPPSFYSLLPE